MAEEAIGQGAAEALMEEHEQQRDTEPFVSEAIRVAAAVTFEQAMCLEFPQIVAELVESVLSRRELELRRDGLVDLRGLPAGHGEAAVEQDFHEPDHAQVVNLDAGHLGAADLNRERQALEEREVHVNVEPLCLRVGEMVGEGEKLLAHRVQMVEPFLQLEVAEVVGAELVAQERAKLLVLAEEAVLAVDAEDMMPLFQLVEGGMQLPLEPFGQAQAKQLGDLLGGEQPEPELAGALEDLVDREAPLEDEVAAVLE